MASITGRTISITDVASKLVDASETPCTVRLSAPGLTLFLGDSSVTATDGYAASGEVEYALPGGVELYAVRSTPTPVGIDVLITQE